MVAKYVIAIILIIMFSSLMIVKWLIKIYNILKGMQNLLDKGIGVK